METRKYLFETLWKRYLNEASATDGKNQNILDSYEINETEIPAKAKYNFHLIPDGKNNYRSAQISLADYPEIIKTHGIKNIIRMNAAETSGVAPDEEKKMCEKEGCTYNFINAHEGYVSGKGYVGTLKKVLPILKKGNTLVHCTHGADRTGYVVASYLRDIGSIPSLGEKTDKDNLWKYTTQYNSWNNYINSGKFFDTGYAKYADAFYPIEELKKSKWNTKK